MGRTARLLSESGNMNRLGKGLLGTSAPAPRVQPRPYPLYPVDIAGCPYAEGH